MYRDLDSPLSTLRPVLHVQDHTSTPGKEEVVVEHLVRVSVDGNYTFSLSCSPAHLQELVVGALYCRGYLDSAEKIASLTFSPDRTAADVRLFPDAAPAETPAAAPEIRVGLPESYALMRHDLNASALFRRTGGVHCVSLLSPGQEILSLEDLARHNAVDKVVGYALLHHRPLDQSIMAVSGRLSADMMEKAVRAKIPVVLSKGAPTDRSIRLAEENHVTLVGFLRGERMNIYTWPERIDLQS